MPDVHPTAIVAPGANLDAGVKVGPYAILGPHVTIGAGSEIMGHVFIDGHTSMGADCICYPFCSIGTRTQDLKYQGGTPGLRIGDRTTIRESVTVNAATHDGDRTVIGSDCLLMAYAHVAHDCQVGNGVIVANCGTLAGHVIIEDGVILGGLSGVHQFVRIGRMSIIGGCSKVTQDVPPFMTADGHPLSVRGLNTVGLKRRNMATESVKLLKRAYRYLYREDLPTRAAIVRIETELEQVDEIQQLLAFLKSSERGIVH